MDRTYRFRPRAPAQCLADGRCPDRSRGAESKSGRRAKVLQVSRAANRRSAHDAWKTKTSGTPGLRTRARIVGYSRSPELKLSSSTLVPPMKSGTRRLTASIRHNAAFPPFRRNHHGNKSTGQSSSILASTPSAAAYKASSAASSEPVSVRGRPLGPSMSTGPTAAPRSGSAEADPPS